METNGEQNRSRLVAGYVAYVFGTLLVVGGLEAAWDNDMSKTQSEAHELSIETELVSEQSARFAVAGLGAIILLMGGSALVPDEQRGLS